MSSPVYSKAPEASPKRVIDAKLLSSGVAMKLDGEDYLKALVSAAFTASGTKLGVSSSAFGMQFFIINGGGEGFLSAGYGGLDASRVVSVGPTTSGKPGTTMIFDDNDLIVAFDRFGKLVSSALLRRPLAIQHPNIWSEATANRVYAAWDGRPVSLYRNTAFDIKYYGLKIDDSLGLYRSGAVRVDIHKEEATNGCIFVVDPNTPDYSDATKLNTFEPAFIVDVQTAVGAKIKHNIGTMHMLKLK
jgi:hypothetical protein